MVEHVENPHLEMSLAEARRLDPTVREGEYLDIEVSPAEFGRIAAQTAKQVVAQRIREAERDIIYSEFSSRDGDVVTGVVQRREGRTGTVFIDMGKVEAILPPSEQSPLDSYRFGDRIKVYVLEVKRTTKTPRVLVSRSHPGLLRRLFELEVPELQEGVVEIKAQAREAGARSQDRGVVAAGERGPGGSLRGSPRAPACRPWWMSCAARRWTSSAGATRPAKYVDGRAEPGEGRVMSPSTRARARRW